MTNLFDQAFKGIDLATPPSLQETAEVNVVNRQEPPSVPDTRPTSLSAEDSSGMIIDDDSSTYRIVLDYVGDTLRAYMAVHEFLELDVKTCRDLVKAAPSVLLEGIKGDRAAKLHRDFDDRGISVHIERMDCAE